MSIDKRFALIDRDGAYRYPYKKTQRATNRHGFVLGPDRHGKGEYTEDIERVIQAVVLDGETVRVKTEDGHPGKRGNGLSLHAQQEIAGYWLSPELLHLVAKARFRPINDVGVTPSPPVSSMPMASPAAPAPSVTPADPLAEVSRLTCADYVRACEAIAREATPHQIAMLTGHALAPGQTLSMEAIAALGGYDSYSAANIQYGALARSFADFFGIAGLENQTQVLAIVSTDEVMAFSGWTLRPAVVQALEQLGLIEGPTEEPGFAEASKEVSEDPQAQGIPETMKRALINARIGQGGYRRRMIRLWDGKCAVTDCPVEKVLIASHAKPWSVSSNRERLDEYNGFLLAASIDKLFDLGLISFSDDGSLLVSQELDDVDISTFGLKDDSRLRPTSARHLPYLQAHRKQHGYPV